MRFGPFRIDPVFHAGDGETAVPHPVGVPPDHRPEIILMPQIAVQPLETEDQRRVVPLKAQILQYGAPRQNACREAARADPHALDRLAVRRRAEYFMHDPVRRLLVRSQAEAADADIFGVEVVLDALMAAFAADAGLLDAAERRLHRGDQALIDAHHPVFQPFHDPEGAAEIAGVEVAGEAEFGVVGEVDRLLLRLEPEHGSDRARKSPPS